MVDGGMTLRQMEVFYAIMRAGTVTGAAGLLNATQPGISMVLRHCETQLGVRLFERVGGRLQPTPEAEALLPEVAAVFTRLNHVRQRTRDLRAGRGGVLSIAAAFPIANGYLAGFIAAFMARHPGLRVDLHSLTSPQVLDRVVNREAELGLAFDVRESPAVEVDLLMRTGISCVMKPDHPLAERAEIDVRDLAGEPIVTYLPQIPMRTLVDHAFIEGAVTPRIVAQVTISLTGIMLAAAGVGIALVEPLMVEAMAAPRVVARPLRPAIGMSAYLIRHRNAPPSRMMRAFVDDLQRAVAAPSPEAGGT
jgi:DNA-binding transcriptional LysR family regulator